MKLFGRKKDPAEVKNVIADVMMARAYSNMENGRYKEALEIYLDVANKFPQNADAAHNIGSMLATGKGTDVNFIEAGYWFRKSAEGGDEKGNALVNQVIGDYISDMLNKKLPRKQVFDNMVAAMKRIFPEMDADQKATANLYAFGGGCFNRKDYATAAKLFRIAGEYGNHGYAQNYLAVLYNAGAGVEQNDLAALYWFDRALDNGIAEARQDRFGIFNAYMENLSEEDFAHNMRILASWCENGTEDIPKDPQKAAFWLRTIQ